MAVPRRPQLGMPVLSRAPFTYGRCYCDHTLVCRGSKNGSCASQLTSSPTPEGDREEVGKDQKKSETTHFKRINTGYMSLLGTLP